MYGHRDFFEQLARPGAELFEFLAGSPVERQYLELVDRIHEVIAGIHDYIVKAVVEVGEARSLAEARADLATLDVSHIRSDLKARRLCDELEYLGGQFVSMLQTSGHNGEPAALAQLARDLVGREQRTAELYSEQLYDLRILPDTAQDLDDLKAKADAIAGELTFQKAAFDLIAKKAIARRGHLS